MYGSGGTLGSGEMAGGGAGIAQGGRTFSRGEACMAMGEIVVPEREELEAVTPPLEDRYRLWRRPILR